jgi:hypothetical protein
MSEMNKKHDGSRTVRALKVSLVTASALWASPVVAAPPPGSPAVTVYVCIHDSFRPLEVSSYNSGEIAFLVPFETSPGVLADTQEIIIDADRFIKYWTPKPVTVHCATTDGCKIVIDSRLIKPFPVLVPPNFLIIDQGPNYNRANKPNDLAAILSSTLPTKCPSSPR